MARSYTLLIASAIILATIHRHVTASISAVCVFRREEVDLHKYSAILAAIKPVRGQLDKEIKKALSPIDYYFHKMKGELYWLTCLTHYWESDIVKMTESTGQKFRIVYFKFLFVLFIITWLFISLYIQSQSQFVVSFFDLLIYLLICSFC